jgi:hypothetical protein
LANAGSCQEDGQAPLHGLATGVVCAVDEEFDVPDLHAASASTGASMSNIVVRTGMDMADSCDLLKTYAVL